MIYLDSAATSFYRPPCVAEAVAEAISSMGNCSRGAYKEALTGARVIFETRVLLSEMFHGDGPEQVAFTANSTESLNIAIKGLIRPGEHAPESAGETEKERVRRLGKLDYKALKAAITPGTRAVVMTHASNLTGNRTDLKKVGEWCRQAGALFIVDASQTAGHFPINIEENHIDVLCFTGHKGLMGPQGTGGLCVRKGLAVKPLLSGGSGILTFEKQHPSVMPTALEAGTLNGHGIAGLRAALLYIKEEGIEAIGAREQKLMQLFYEQVKEIPDIRIYGDFSQKDRAAIVSLNLGEEESGEVSDYLSTEYGIDTRSGGHCAPLMHGALGTVDQGAVRFSFSHFNTEEQVECAVRALKEY